MIVDESKSAELLTLCYRSRWQQARRLIEEEDDSSHIAHAVLRQAVADARQDVVEFVLASTVVELDRSYGKSHRTLLHHAIQAKQNGIVKALIDAGASLEVQDKRRVRPSDLMTWTDTIQPALVEPLQQNIANLRTSIQSLKDRTQCLASSTETTEERIIYVDTVVQQSKANLAIAIAQRKDIEWDTERCAEQTESLEVELASDDPRIACVRQRRKQLQLQADEAHQSLELYRGKIKSTEVECQLLQQKQVELHQQLEAYNTKLCTNSEIVHVLQRLHHIEPLQLSSLLYMHRLLQKPDIRRKLIANGMILLVLNSLKAQPENPDILVNGCNVLSTVLKLTLHDQSNQERCAREPYSSDMLIEYLSDRSLSLTTPSDDRVMEATLGLWNNLLGHLDCMDISRQECQERLTLAYTKLKQHDSYMNLSPNIQNYIIHGLAACHTH